MSDRSRLGIRVLAALLAVASGLAALVLALEAAAFGVLTVAGPGALGATLATVLLLRVVRGGVVATRTDVAVLLAGLAAGAAALAVSAHTLIHSYDPAYRAAMKSDLRNLVSAQDAYFAQHQRYAGSLAALDSFALSPSVRIAMWVSGPDVRAVARHAALRDETCAIFIGGTPVAPATQERTPACGR